MPHWLIHKRKLMISVGDNEVGVREGRRARGGHQRD